MDVHTTVAAAAAAQPFLSKSVVDLSLIGVRQDLVGLMCKSIFTITILGSLYRAPEDSSNRKRRQTSLICLNIASLSSLVPGFLSGWCRTASLR
jgi:hypothetical protein